MSVPISMKTSTFEELSNFCTVLKETVTSGKVPDVNNCSEMTNILNDLFDGSYDCASTLFTNNTDNLLFGINVSPTIIDSDAIKIISTDEPVQLSRYTIEVDLKLFNILDGMEIASMIVEDIASIMLPNTIDIVRSILDTILAAEDSYIEIKQSINYSQILIFGIKDVMRKVSSILYKDEDAIGMNAFAEAFEIKDILVDVAKKVRSSIFGGQDITTVPKLGILKWTLMVYIDIETGYKMAENDLLTARQITGSELEKREIDKTLKSIRRASSEVLNEANILMEKFSLFKNLKMNGLRGIEDDLYEYKIRLKNCETEEEAMYILRQINTRISILEDYLANTDVSDAEAARWRNTIDAYRDLRYELSKKKIANKKQYGIFVDYDKLDQLDNNSSN